MFRFEWLVFLLLYPSMLVCVFSIMTMHSMGRSDAPAGYVPLPCAFFNSESNHETYSGLK